MAARCGNPGARILQAIRLVRAVGHEIDAKLALGRFDRGVDLAFGHAEAFGVELEVMDQRLPSSVFMSARRGGVTLWFGDSTGPAPAGEFSRSMHCFMMRTDWRISSMRIR